MKRKIVPITLISLLLGLVFDWLFYGKAPGVSVPIYSLLILGSTFYLADKFRARLSKSVYGVALAVLFFALMVFVRANPFLAFINIVMVIYLLLVVVNLARQPEARLSQYDIAQYFSGIGRLPLRFIGTFLTILPRSLNRKVNNNSQNSKRSSIIYGIVLSLPILAVFLMLLSSADLVFKHYVNQIFNFHLNISPELVFRVGLVLLVASLLAGAYALIFMRPHPASNDTEAIEKFRLGPTESSIVLGSVGLLFFVFVVVQLAYLFGGSDQITAGYTYAEYARKGFFELITVAFMSLMLIWTIKRITQFQAPPQKLVFKWLSGALIAEVMIIMLSAHMRLNLYEDAYGFTSLRLLSHLFIIWLAVTFALLMVHIVREEAEHKFVFRSFISVIAFLGLVNLINPDAFIAQQNIARFNRTGKIDLHHLSNLTEDAYPEIVGLLHHPNKDLQHAAANILFRQEYRLYNLNTSWQASNLARFEARRAFDNNRPQIEADESYGQDYNKFDGN